jgi:hypothetical protein
MPQINKFGVMLAGAVGFVAGARVVKGSPKVTNNNVTVIYNAKSTNPTDPVKPKDLYSSLEDQLDFLEDYFQLIENLVMYKSLFCYMLPILLLLLIYLYISLSFYNFIKNKLGKEYIKVHLYFYYLSSLIKVQLKVTIFALFFCLLFDLFIYLFM